MIFVTVGTQLPFPRLIDAMDRIAAGLDETVIAQTGPGDGAWAHLDHRAGMPPAEFAETFAAARIVVAHAGIGTILSARGARKPLVIMPRRAALGEHRNDHQMATARQVASMKGVHVAEDEAAIAALIAAEGLEAAEETPGPGRARLITRIRDFIG